MSQEMPKIITEEKKVKMEDVLVFGQKLTEAREKINKRHKAIAQEIGVNPGTPYHWEKGEEFPDENKLPKIAQAYGIDLEKLTEIFILSRAARELEKEARRPIPAHFSKRGSDNEFDPSAPERSARLKRSRTRF